MEPEVVDVVRVAGPGAGEGEMRVRMAPEMEERESWVKRGHAPWGGLVFLGGFGGWEVGKETYVDGCGDGVGVDGRTLEAERGRGVVRVEEGGVVGGGAGGGGDDGADGGGEGGGGDDGQREVVEKGDVEVDGTDGEGLKRGGFRDVDGYANAEAGPRGGVVPWGVMRDLDGEELLGGVPVDGDVEVLVVDDGLDDDGRSRAVGVGLAEDDGALDTDGGPVVLAFSNVLDDGEGLVFGEGDVKLPGAAGYLGSLARAVGPGEVGAQAGSVHRRGVLGVGGRVEDGILLRQLLPGRIRAVLGDRLGSGRRGDDESREEG